MRLGHALWNTLSQTFVANLVDSCIIPKEATHSCAKALRSQQESGTVNRLWAMSILWVRVTGEPGVQRRAASGQLVRRSSPAAGACASRPVAPARVPRAGSAGASPSTVDDMDRRRSGVSSTAPGRGSRFSRRLSAVEAHPAMQNDARCLAAAPRTALYYASAIHPEFCRWGRCTMAPFTNPKNPAAPIHPARGLFGLAQAFAPRRLAAAREAQLRFLG